MPNDVLKVLIDSLVLSHLTYALPAWGPAISKQFLTRLQRQHNWAVRIVKNLRMSSFMDTDIFLLSGSKVVE